METNELNPGMESGEELTWEEMVAMRERSQHPMPHWHKAETFKTRNLNVRLSEKLLTSFDTASLERGMNLSEGIRQLMVAWLRNPEALPIGLPPSKH